MFGFLKNFKIIAKILATFRNNIYLWIQNNGRVPFIGIGVSPIGRVVRFVATLHSFCCDPISTFIQKLLIIIHKVLILALTSALYNGRNSAMNIPLYRPMTVMTDDSFLNWRRKEC